MRNFFLVGKFYGGSLKNPIFRGQWLHEKPIYRGNYQKKGERLWQFANLRRGFDEKERVVFLRGEGGGGESITQCTLYKKSKIEAKSKTKIMVPPLLELERVYLAIGSSQSWKGHFIVQSFDAKKKKIIFICPFSEGLSVKSSCQ